MAKWYLKQEEVSTGGSSGTSSCPDSKYGPRLKRAHLVLHHRPTGISVEGYIDPTIKSKKAWKKIYQEVWDKLFLELEQQVAKHLKIPGR